MFIDTLGHEEDVKISVLNAIVNFAQNAKLEIIAEGVESIDQVNRLADMGVFAIQGYVYGKPMNSADFIQWMTSHQPILSE
ncbi:MAG: periplasmic sensor diguanylate phosphodiesterase, partial [Burkholderiaceae bacterium]|nr:periplasmic sensor diguanylate phosphodiesterase [Burkholderiaceae bacterium]